MPKLGQPLDVIRETDALPGRSEAILDSSFRHRITHQPLQEQPSGHHVGYFAMGCFWGPEKLFWQLDGVTSTAVGYLGGFTPNPTYEEVCSGQTGHAETVRVVFDPEVISYPELLQVFFENHDPTQGMRQGNDMGSQYRSAIFIAEDDHGELAQQALHDYQDALTAAGLGHITTEISPAHTFYYAEDYHQQYLSANPDGYCPNHATGVKCTREA